MGGRAFLDRREAGRLLAIQLERSCSGSDLVVIGLARGGVPVAAEVAEALGAALDVAVVRKLGVPGHEELAMGAITRDRMVVNEHLVHSLGVTQPALDAVVDRERHELARREQAYRLGRPARGLVGKTVVLVDDGLATGATMQAAVLTVTQQRPASVIVAVPTASAQAAAALRGVADAVVCLQTPSPFIAVGLSYRDFRQVTDDEVRAALD